MGEWEMVRLGDAATFINGYPFKPSDWKTTGVPIIRIQNLTESSNVINYYDKEYNPRYEINDGDILISWSASLGVYEWVKGKALLNQHIFKVVFDKVRFDKRFFKYTVGRKIDEMAKFTHGSTMKHITKKYFDEIQIPLPPLPIQRKIADILDCTNSLIGKRKAQISKLDLLVKSQFVEMFFSANSNNEFWSVKSIDEVSIKMRTGPFGSSLLHSEFVNIGVFVLGIDNAVENRFSYNRMRYITEEKYEQLIRYTVHPGDIIITIMGTVGRSAVVPDGFPKAINTKHLACITANREMINPVFLCHAFQYHPLLLQQIKKNTKGAIMAGLNLTIIKNLQFPLPPLELQNQFAEFVQATEKSKSEIQRSLDKLELLRKSLMQQYFY